MSLSIFSSDAAPSSSWLITSAHPYNFSVIHYINMLVLHYSSSPTSFTLHILVALFVSSHFPCHSSKHLHLWYFGLLFGVNCLFSWPKAYVNIGLIYILFYVFSPSHLSEIFVVPNAGYSVTNVHFVTACKKHSKVFYSHTCLVGSLLTNSLHLNG